MKIIFLTLILSMIGSKDDWQCVCSIDRQEERPFLENSEYADIVGNFKILSVSRDSNTMTIMPIRIFKGEPTTTNLIINGDSFKNPCNHSIRGFMPDQLWILGINEPSNSQIHNYIDVCADLWLKVEAGVIAGNITQMHFGDQKEYMTLDQFGKLFEE
ncbi:MAG: hypothetical protein R2813_11340 [Flavobacteriales bacterium]